MSDYRCRHCGLSFDPQIAPIVNVSSHPELKEKVLSGEMFIRECPHCSKPDLVVPDMLYIDHDHKLLVCLSQNNLNSAGGELPDYTCRLTSSVGELIEKIKINDAGLDDVAVEMCKFVTLQELGKDVDLKFYRMDSADAELVFAYPENGRMEMLAIGFNMYEDSIGILKRNPQLEEAAAGLKKVDRNWLLEFLG